MAEAILVPQVGQDLTEATIVEMHVKLGDSVKKGDLVAVVESEKASFEVEAFAEGTVISLPYKAGDVAPVLEPLMHLGAPGETIETSANVVSQSGVVAAPSMAEAAVEVSDHTPALGKSGTLRASPVARRKAAEHGLDIARVPGSGPAGAVVLKDILASVGLGTASGAPLELRTLKAGKGTPVVLLHGFGADLSSWRLMVAQMDLAQPVLAIDLPGHGASLENAADSFEQIVEAVARTLRTGGGSAHLVGHSLGAAIAIALADRADLDIRSLTLLSPGGLCPSVNGDFVEGFLAAHSEPALTAWMQRLVHDPATLAPVLVRATLEARKTPGLIEGQTRIARAVFEGATQLFSVAQALARYAGPCTVLAGREDGIIPMADIERNLPANAALHRLANTGHLPQIEAAELTQTLIARTVRSAG
jgi:pimeloyl-ACP methyl ester carboxylesterase